MDQQVGALVGRRPASKPDGESVGLKLGSCLLGDAIDEALLGAQVRIPDFRAVDA
jgi:hypothetical protein